jgi:hypothetical protein
MQPADILGQPQAWRQVSRREAMRECATSEVVVLYASQGCTVASVFGHGSRFFQANGPYDYTELKYFLRIRDPFGTPRPKAGYIPPPPQPTDLPAEPEPVQELEEPVKKGPAIKISKLDCDSFAPLIDIVGIHYEISGDLEQAQSMHLRIASQKQADKILLDKRLDASPQAKGILNWDGSVTDGEYQGCVNLAGSPYWVQLGLAAKGGSPVFTNQVALKVELLQTEMTVTDLFGLGEDDGYKNAAALASLKDDLKKTPGKGVIRMPGSFFKATNDEMYNGASYTVYAGALGKGVPIPLFVNLWLKGKDGGKKRSPQAVAGTRILWDALPDDEAALDANFSDRGVNDAAKKFMKRISAYKKDRTEPPGATAQWELGGIRADAQARKGDRLQFRDLADEWKTAPAAKRGWAGYSQCGKTGTAQADSGMLYYNGRIAGDRYHVTAYVDLDGSLDDKAAKPNDTVPAPRKTQTLSLQNWRDVNLAKGYVIGEGDPPLSFGEANGEFKKAALSILPKPGMVPEEIHQRWKSEYKDAVTVLSGLSFIKDAALTDPGGYPAAFIGYNDYWAKSHPDAGFFGRLWHRIKAFFGASDEEDYIQKCDNASRQLYFETAKAFPMGRDGLTYFKFSRGGEHNRHGDTHVVGIAPFIAGYSTRTQAVLFVFDPGQAVDTVVHEMGHNLFLPHAPGGSPGNQPQGAEPKLHDTVQVCMMSYHPDKKHFCALCFLRMGGWDHTSIRNNGTVIDAFELE